MAASVMGGGSSDLIHRHDRPALSLSGLTGQPTKATMLHGPRSVVSHVLAVARGDEPADLLLRGGKVLSPSTREWVTTDLRAR